MKILKLVFENINNLKGNHTIDFTEKPLVNADIFAIIGATGSGKSTLLDVITLVLFNRTPRFKKVSKKTLSEEGSIITRNEKRASAKITYSAGGKEYVSVWNIKYTNRNTLGEYHMEIWEDGVVLDLHRRDVPKKNESIIGLDYEQFTKAIILSQGEFAKFLKADHNERSALLEKITGTSIYRELGIKAFEIHREKKNLLEQKQAVFETIRLLSEDEVKTLKSKQNTLKKELETQKKSLEKTLKSLKQKEDFLTMETQLKVLTVQQKENITAIKNFAEQEKKLQLHKKVVPFRKELSDFSKKREQISRNKVRLQEHQEKLAKEIKRKTEVITQQNAIIRQEEITEENFLAKNNAFEKKVNQLVSDLKHVFQKGTEQKQEIEELLSSKYLADFRFDSTITSEIISEKLNEIRTLLQAENYKLTSDVLAIETDKTELEKTIQDYKELKKYHQRYKEIEDETKKCNHQISEFENLLISLPKKLQPLQKQEELLKLEIQKLEIEQKIASLEEHRKELKKDEECPLCGSVHHPFSMKEVEQEETLSARLQAKKNELETIKKQISEIQTQEKLIKSKIETQKNTISKNTKKLSEFEHRTKTELHHPELLAKLSEVQLSELLETSEKKHQKIVQILRSFQKIEPLNQLKNKVEKRLELLSDYQNIKKQKDDLFEGDAVSEKMNELQNIFNESKSNVLIHENNIRQEKETLKNNETEFVALQKDIDLVIEKTSISDIESLQKAILSDDVISRIEATQKQLSEEKTKVEALLKQTQERFDKFKTDEIQQLNIEHLKEQKLTFETKNETIIGEISAIEQQLKHNSETAKQKQEHQQEVTKLTKEFTRWDNLKRLIGDGTGKQFSSFAQGLTLKQLIAFTNKRLQSFSGRYLLYSEPVNQELMIIDTIQGNTERSVKTLSGGETFLVSLALALSLSDMASKNVKLESLFIDEGFGTLDEDTLENALNLLEKLQSESNKTVGVISHVKELKDRIAVQIRMQKNSLGYSSLLIVP